MKRIKAWLRLRSIGEPSTIAESQQLFIQFKYSHYISESFSAVLAGIFFINPDIAQYLPNWVSPWISGFFFTAATILLIMVGLPRKWDFLSDFFYQRILGPSLLPAVPVIAITEPLRVFIVDHQKGTLLMWYIIAFLIIFMIVSLVRLEWSKYWWAIRFIIASIMLLVFGIVTWRIAGEAASIAYLMSSLILLVFGFVLAILSPPIQSKGTQ